MRAFSVEDLIVVIDNPVDEMENNIQPLLLFLYRNGKLRFFLLVWHAIHDFLWLGIGRQNSFDVFVSFIAGYYQQATFLSGYFRYFGEMKWWRSIFRTRIYISLLIFLRQISKQTAWTAQGFVAWNLFSRKFQQMSTGYTIFIYIWFRYHLVSNALMFWFLLC